MPYCQKCGNKVDESMTFCPNCGASLQGGTATTPTPPTAPSPPYKRRDEKSEKNEKQEKQEPEKGEKREKGEFGFVGWLIGGLVLIIIGFFSLLQFGGYFTSGESWAIMLLIIGVVIIIAAIYLTSLAKKRYPPTS
jgi:predicted lipid-binding transport protein (Tim44 family)